MPTLAHDTLFARHPMDYYWSVEQSEWASDVLFRDPADLARLYPQLVHHGIEHLSCCRCLALSRSQGGGHFEIHSSKKTRREGVRVKYWINGNSIKMYDKQGQILRIESTLNNVSDYRAYRTKEGDDGGTKQWMPMRKGVADLARRAEVSQAGNSRYLDTLATAEDTTPLAELTTRVCQPVHWQGQRARSKPSGGQRRRLADGSQPWRVYAQRLSQPRPASAPVWRQVRASSHRTPPGCSGNAAVATAPGPRPDSQGLGNAPLHPHGPGTHDHHGITCGPPSRYAQAHQCRMKIIPR